MIKSCAFLLCLSATLLLSACDPTGNHETVSAELLTTARDDPLAFGTEILRLEQRLADNQTQLPKWRRGTANAILIAQQIEADKNKIEQMMKVLSQLEAQG